MEFIVQNAINTSQASANQFENVVGQANIKVVGVGGAGGNMVNWLYNKNIHGAEIIAVNTDQQHLEIHNADRKIFRQRGY